LAYKYGNNPGNQKGRQQAKDHVLAGIPSRKVKSGINGGVEDFAFQRKKEYPQKNGHHNDQNLKFFSDFHYSILILLFIKFPKREK
jgi:hypothetical protein